MSRLIGHTLDGRYRIDAFVAAGGMGAVYRGTQLSVDRPVAIKVIREADGESIDRVAIQRFFREAQSISQLQHPNVVGLVDFGKEGELVYLVMEFVDGHSLRGLLEGGRSNPSFVTEALRQIASGLAQAHAHDLVHRDLKPDNLLVMQLASGHVQVKVVDFGIARMAKHETLSDSGSVIGTPHYMSPEQAMDEALDGRADLFSLGIIAYEMIAGQLPFDASEPLQTMLKICHEPFVRLDEVVDTQIWPQGLLDLVHRLLEKSPEARPRSASEVLDRLETVQRDASLPVPRVRERDSLRDVARTEVADVGERESNAVLERTVDPHSDTVGLAATDEREAELSAVYDVARPPRGLLATVAGLAILVVVSIAALVVSSSKQVEAPNTTEAPASLAKPAEPASEPEPQVQVENPGVAVAETSDPLPAEPVPDETAANGDGVDAPTTKDAPPLREPDDSARDTVPSVRRPKRTLVSPTATPKDDSLDTNMDWLKRRGRE